MFDWLASLVNDLSTAAKVTLGILAFGLFLAGLGAYILSFAGAGERTRRPIEGPVMP